MRFFAKIRDVFISILSKITCKSSCFNSTSITINDDHSNHDLKYKEELKIIRHEIKNTLNVMNYLLNYSEDHEKPIFKQKLNKTIDLVNSKINPDYIKNLVAPVVQDHNSR